MQHSSHSFILNTFEILDGKQGFCSVRNKVQIILFIRSFKHVQADMALLLVSLLVNCCGTTLWNSVKSSYMFKQQDLGTHFQICNLFFQI